MNLFKLDQSNEKASLEILGEIVTNRSEMFDSENYRIFCLQEFEEDLRELPDSVKQIEVYIDSPGGSQSSGMEIYRALKDFPASITVTVGSNASSAASVIMCAGDVIRVYDTSVVMIHRGWQPLIEGVNVDDLEAYMKDLSAKDEQMAHVYSQKSGKNIEEILQAMSETTYLRGQQIVDYGLADVLIQEGGTQSLSLEEVKAMNKEQMKKALQGSVKAWQSQNAVLKADETDKEKKDPEQEAPQKETPEQEEPEKEDPEKKEEESESKKKEGCVVDYEAEYARIQGLFSFAKEANLTFDLVNSAFENGATADQLAREIVIATASSARAQAKETQAKKKEIKNAYLEDMKETDSVPVNPVNDTKAKQDNKDQEWDFLISAAKKEMN